MKKRSEFPIHVLDYDGREVVITEESWSHVIEGHDELRDQLETIKETLRDPNYVELDDTMGGSVLRYYRLCKRLIRSGYLLVLVAETSSNPRAGKLLTAYLVSGIKKGGTMLWLKR